ncbi:DUF4383 domain-containing protein [Cryobacterium sp. BB736]|uniref:DUF4383 domain-containing protein n=1 Tax=Cryobacterium sp. BB736 TaxID=2746963 RepID=UPI001873866F|nr:DUF4383 domain-containing protein [Cryobacterium sp. BB736]
MATESARGANNYTERYAETPLQKAALIFGIVFLLVGILGFIPGVTTNIDTMMFAGHESEALLLGIFQVSIFHNLVHLLFGILGVWLAARWSWSRWYLIIGGVIYLVLWLYGLIVDEASAANFVPFNDADDWLHLILGIAMILLGVLLSRRMPTRTAEGSVS